MLAAPAAWLTSVGFFLDRPHCPKAPTSSTPGSSSAPCAAAPTSPSSGTGCSSSRGSSRGPTSAPGTSPSAAAGTAGPTRSAKGRLFRCGAVEYCDHHARHLLRKCASCGRAPPTKRQEFPLAKYLGRRFCRKHPPGTKQQAERAAVISLLTWTGDGPQTLPQELLEGILAEVRAAFARPDPQPRAVVEPPRRGGRARWLSRTGRCIDIQPDGEPLLLEGDE